MSSAKTAAKEWLNAGGFEVCDECLSELRAKGVQQIYLSNFEFIPPDVSPKEVCYHLNRDGGDWKFEIVDGTLTATIKAR